MKHKGTGIKEKEKKDNDNVDQVPLMFNQLEDVGDICDICCREDECNDFTCNILGERGWWEHEFSCDA